MTERPNEIVYPQRGEKLQVHSMKGLGVFQSRGVCQRGAIGCRRPTLWIRTPAGERMPLDPHPDAAGIYTSHYATCPDAEKFRRKPAYLPTPDEPPDGGS